MLQPLKKKMTLSNIELHRELPTLLTLPQVCWARLCYLFPAPSSPPTPYSLPPLPTHSLYSLYACLPGFPVLVQAGCDCSPVPASCLSGVVPPPAGQSGSLPLTYLAADLAGCGYHYTLPYTTLPALHTPLSAVLITRVRCCRI